MTGVFTNPGNVKAESHTQREEGPVRTEAETGEMCFHSPGRPRMAGDHQKLGAGQETGSLPEPAEGSNPAHTLIMDFWPPDL